ncbi:hypothetical protein BDY24DRAFT_103582 [Mrakia frigida]|uniref:uncharacterized protein n=1 Tax=Mrakia frigida TaxID=29902 RepID=UPI003FCBEE52
MAGDRAEDGTKEEEEGIWMEDGEIVLIRRLGWIRWCWRRRRKTRRKGRRKESELRTRRRRRKNLLRSSWKTKKRRKSRWNHRHRLYRVLQQRRVQRSRSRISLPSLPRTTIKMMASARSLPSVSSFPHFHKSYQRPRNADLAYLRFFSQTSFSPPSRSNSQSNDDLPSSSSFADEPSFSSTARSPFPSSPSFDADGFGGFSSPQMMDDIGGDEEDPWGRDVELDPTGGGGGGWSAGGDEDDGEDWGEPKVLAGAAGEDQAAGVGTGKVDEWEEASRLAAKRQARAVSSIDC